MRKGSIFWLTEPEVFHYVRCLQNAVVFSNPAASRGRFLRSLALFGTVWYPSLALGWTERLAPGTGHLERSSDALQANAKPTQCQRKK